MRMTICRAISHGLLCGLSSWLYIISWKTDIGSYPDKTRRITDLQSSCRAVLSTFRQEFKLALLHIFINSGSRHEPQKFTWYNTFIRKQSYFKILPLFKNMRLNFTKKTANKTKTSLTWLKQKITSEHEHLFRNYSKLVTTFTNQIAHILSEILKWLISVYNTCRSTGYTKFPEFWHRSCENIYYGIWWYLF